MSRPSGAADWRQTLAAEKLAISLGILDPCPHEGVMGPCTRAQHHELPHAVPGPPEPARTSANTGRTSP